MEGIKRFIVERPLWVTLIITAVTLSIVLYSVYLPKFPTLKTPNQNINNAQIPNINTSVKHIIVAASQRTDYSLTLTDQKNLVITFDSLKIWDKIYKGNNTAPLTNVIISLTKNPQPTEQKDDKGNVVFSYSLYYEKDTAIITVYFPDTLLGGPAPSAFFGAAVVTVASKMGGTNKTIAEIPNNSLISGFFLLQKTTTQTGVPPKASPPSTK